MFGQNPVTKPRTEDFVVHSMFYTIQGEGPWAGLPTIFVRLTGCNLRCFWCDTDFTGGKVMSAEMLHGAIHSMSLQHNCHRVVITGGEPLLQPLPLLFTRTANTRLMYQIETAGTVWPEGLGAYLTRISWGVCGRAVIVVSPKTLKIRPEVVNFACAWKYIVGEEDLQHLNTLGGDGLPTASTQFPDARVRIARKGDYPNAPEAEIFVQARDDQDEAANARNLKAAAEIAMRQGYRLSVQVHKLVGLD